MNRLKTKFIILFLAIFSSSLIIGEEYIIDSASSWIEKIDIPAYELNPEDIFNGEYYLLSDMQVQLDPREFFNHFAILIDNSTGLENNSQISIDFDPEYEELIIHKIQVIRQGIAIDKLDSAITSVIQKENELEKLIYNGTKSFYAILSDMRIGDILEVSFTIRELNPIFPDYSDRFYVQWAVPVKMIYRRILSDNANSINYRFNNESLEPEVKNQGKELIWKSEDVQAVYYDEYVPFWYDAHNYIELSQYSNWKEISAMVLDFYKSLTLEKEQAEYIFSNYPEITNDSSHEEIVEILLNAVQEDIRYMGIEIGRGSYIPTEPYDVYSRKFGDCKDKSLLLSELLKHKDIEAYPVLVHNSSGRNLVNVLPSPYQFNHVIVKIIVNEKTYWFDPTYTFQEGTLENLSQADYGYGLVISDKTSDLEEIIPGFKKTNTTFNEIFTLPSEISESGSYTIESIYHNDDADYMRSYLSNSPHGTIADELLEYMEFYYEDLSIEKDFEYIDDRDANRLTLLEYYTIPHIWKYHSEENHYRFTYSPFEIYNYTEELNELDRTMPYSLRHPVKVVQNVTIKLPEEWDIDKSNDSLKTKYFIYNQKIDYSAKELKMTYQYESLQDSVPHNEIEEYNSKMVEIGESIDYQIFWNPEENPPLDLKMLFIPLAVLAYIILRIIKTKKTIDQIH